MEIQISKNLVRSAKQLSASLKQLQFDFSAYLYNPLEYAFEPYCAYINKYGNSKKSILFVGMNPGPFGMCQTGVPFGEVNHVRDWLKIQEEVYKPKNECPNLPVLGFSCKRSEISGLRLWGCFKTICETPENFFRNCFVHNYCPLAFIGERGQNITPTEIKSNSIQDMEELCDEHLCEVIKLLQPQHIVGIGRYAQQKCASVTKRHCMDNEVHYLLHPSPRATASTEKWLEKANDFFHGTGLINILKEHT